ncbi:MAG TPA: MFS transporter [Chitinophagaceae bacterium]|nr:MFS transporter [Chitinophagaceae bacterium]
MLAPVLNTYKNAYTGLSRSTWLLSIVMLINRSGTMVVPFLTLYLIRMGYSVSMAGIVFAFFGFGAFSGAYVGGRLTDRIGFYPVQIITLLGGGIMFFVLSEMKTYWLICLFTYLLAFINEAFRPANSTAIAFYSKPENRTRSYALNRLAINLGWALGSSIGGVLADINYALLFYVDGITNIAAAILIWLFLRPVNVKEENEKHTTPLKLVSAYKDKTYLLFIILTIFFASCFFQFFTNLSPFFYKELHFSEPLIGLLLAINGVIIAVIEMVLIYKLEGKGSNLQYISIGIFMVGIAFFMLNIPGMGSTLAFCTITLLTFGEIFSMPFMNSFWISRTQPGNRGQYAALYTMAWSAAQTLGPLGGSLLAGQFGFKWLWFSAGTLCIIVALAVKKLRRTEQLPIK